MFKILILKFSLVLTLINYIHEAGIAQRERWETEDLKVPGSIPGSGIFWLKG